MCADKLSNAMHLNEDTVLIGGRVVLVPYEEHHVDKYHRWMSDPRLQLLTGSEPLTLDEEFDMQRKWRQDADSKYVSLKVHVKK